MQMGEARPAAYPVDEASIEASERAITDFLMDFKAHYGAEKVHVLAHSMGNRGLLRAATDRGADAGPGAVQPDLPRRARCGPRFVSRPRPSLPGHAERTALYASNGDLPVHLSAKLHDAPRCGYFIPYTVAPGIDTVAVPDFDVDLGHAYCAQAETLLLDIHDLMRHNEAPAQRQRITPAVYEGTAFWRLRR